VPEKANAGGDYPGETTNELHGNVQEKNTKIELNCQVNTIDRMQIFRDYLDARLPVIPIHPGTKIPIHTGWNEPDRIFTQADFEPNHNAGLRLGTQTPHGYFIEIDYDDSDATKFESFTVFLRLYELHDTLTISSGGKHDGFKLIYRVSEPLDLNGIKKARDWHGAQVDIRSSGQAIIPPSCPDPAASGDLENSKVFSEYQIIHPAGTATLNPVDIKVITPEQLRKLAGSLPTWTPTEKQPPPPLSPSKTKQQSTTIQYSIVVYSELERAWERLIRDAYQKVYGGPLKQTLRIGGGYRATPVFKCVLHPEQNPSAQLCRGDNGVIVYHDYHWKKHGGKEFYTLQEIFTILYEGWDALWTDEHPDPFNVWAGKKTRKIVKYFRAWSERGREIEKWYKTAAPELNYLDPSTRHVLNTLVQYAKECASCGDYPFLCSARFVNDTFGIHHATANQAMNILRTLRILTRGDRVKCKTGTSYRYSINLEADLEAAFHRWEQMKAGGITGPSTFSGRKLKKIFGEREADMIVQRGPDPPGDAVDRKPS